MLIAGNDYTFEVQIKSPMGWVKVNASFHILSETAFTGQAKLLGFTVELADCVLNGAHVRCAASPKLPFGVLRVEIEADIHEDGSVSGIANAPRHKPMEIKGQLVSNSTALTF